MSTSVDTATGDRTGARLIDLQNPGQALPASVVSFAISDVPIDGHLQDIVDCSLSAFGREQALKTGKVLAIGALEALANDDLLAEFKAAKTR